MNIVDTDALSHHMKSNKIGQALTAHMAVPGADFRITAVSAFEMVEGAVALFLKLKKICKELIPGFNLIQEVVEYLGRWQGRVLAYNGGADRIYSGFSPRIRPELGDDARIAAIAPAHGAAVWTRNVSDFNKIPQLIVIEAESGVVVP